jgi:Fe-S cluster assembly iron-binding protein IscA/alpha/beta superfamily hydrolase
MRTLLRIVALSLCLSLGACGMNVRAAEEPAKRPEQAPSKTDKLRKKNTKKPGRKDIIELTPRAAKKILEIMKEIKKEKKHPLFLRVRVEDGAFKLDLDPDTDDDKDYFGESHGVGVVVDRETAHSLPVGTSVDYIEEGKTKGFKISLPLEKLGLSDPSITLAQARRGFKTTLTRRSRKGPPPAKPPAGLLNLVRYESPVGKLAAYLTPDPKDGKKHPAIIWITGGDCNSIDKGCWHDEIPLLDQSASGYRKAGMVMMYPSLRGGNDNPGAKEGFLGEVEDVLAAADFLRKQPFVDPKRIYLGGHSTGGTLVLLVSEYSPRFRAVFSFGPVENVLGYGLRFNPFAVADKKELRLRAPGLWLHSIRSPTFVFEGTDGGNVDSLRAMSRTSKNPRVHFFVIKGANHFNLLVPINRIIAQKLLRDTAAECNLKITAEEVNKPFAK